MAGKEGFTELEKEILTKEGLNPDEINPETLEPFNLKEGGESHEENEEREQREQDSEVSSEQRPESESAGGESERESTSEKQEVSESDELFGSSLTDEQIEYILSKSSDEKGVPKSVIKSVREGKRQAEAKAKELELRLAERLDAEEKFLKILNPQQEGKPEDVVPDRYDDPDGYFDYINKKTNDAIEAQAKITQNIQQQQHLQSVKIAITELENQFEQENAGFKERKAKATDFEVRRMKALQPNLSDAQIRKSIEDNYMNVILQNASTNNNPLNSLDAYFKETVGSQASSEKKVEEKAKPNLSKLNKLQEQHTTVQGGTQGEDDGFPSVEQLANYSQKQLMELQVKCGGTQKFYERVNKAVRQAGMA